jgi:peptidoglycan/xylan/chitin deacetylase (PgdA/CDA1 family)
MWKKHLKALIAQPLYRTGAYRWFFRNKATLVLFHRIDDALAGDPISCTRNEFTAYCRFFKRYFNVISFNDLLDRLENRQDISRTLVITFDDGYRDNYEIAAPVLHQLGLPACFFIATDFIGSSIIPWWDWDKGIHSRWMSWDQVRALRAEGFEIGAHTCTHPDLATLSDAEVEREISSSKARLEAELEEPTVLFSYPYGRKNQMTDNARRLVRSLNLRCCPSAYGGAVSGDSDPYHLMRQPISPWYLSPWHFGFEALLEKAHPSTLRKAATLDVQPARGVVSVGVKYDR